MNRRIAKKVARAVVAGGRHRSTRRAYRIVRRDMRRGLASAGLAVGFGFGRLNHAAEDAGGALRSFAKAADGLTGSLDGDPEGGPSVEVSMDCEACGKPATHVCSGLDVPELAYCAAHAEVHGDLCEDVRDGRASIVKQGATPDGVDE